MTSDTSTKEIEEQIHKLEPWFHNLHLPNDIKTAPNHFLGDFPAFKWKEIAAHIPDDLTGMTALDIGCNAGFYSFELAKRGATVKGIDLDPHYLDQARWAAQQMGLGEKVKFEQKQVYDLAKEEETYDIVWFMGVLYHLRYPMLALDILAQKANKLMVVQTLTMPGEEELEISDNYTINDRKAMLDIGWPKMAFIEKQLNNDPTNWWAPNRACVRAMLRTCGMRVVNEPTHETFICEPDPETRAVATDWNRSEFLSAIGGRYQDDLGKKVVGKRQE